MSSEDRDSITELVSRFQSGVDREETFGEVFRRFHSPVQQFFRRKGFSRDEVRDLTQDTFLGVFKALDTFRGSSSLEAWIYGIATNVYHNELRRRAAYKREGIEESLSEPRHGLSLSEELASPPQDPLAGALEREKQEALLAALQSLPPQMRRCVILRVYQGRKYQEIAALMGISVETVKSHLHQARQRLIGKLQGDS